LQAREKKTNDLSGEGTGEDNDMTTWRSLVVLGHYASGRQNTPGKVYYEYFNTEFWAISEV